MSKNLKEEKKTQELYICFESALIENRKENKYLDINKQLYKLRKRFDLLSFKQHTLLDEYL